MREPGTDEEHAGLRSGQSGPICETARAKINLTLTVRGKRADGYHELESLVAFADFGDRLTLWPGEGRDVQLAVTGPFAHAVTGKNLALTAAEIFLSVCPDARGGHFHLDKRIPVAAGLGGGSADAAAAIRALMRARRMAPLPNRELATRLSEAGADIPVCLESRAAWMTGRGDTVQPFSQFPDVAAVLVNPGVELATRNVFAALSASPLTQEPLVEHGPPEPFADAAALAAYVNAYGNDLETPARHLAPVIAKLLGALAKTEDCLAAQLSGSGPTCFGLFETELKALRAAGRLKREFPAWWIVPARLG